MRRSGSDNCDLKNNFSKFIKNSINQCKNQDQKATKSAKRRCAEVTGRPRKPWQFQSRFKTTNKRSRGPLCARRRDQRRPGDPPADPPRNFPTKIGSGGEGRVRERVRACVRRRWGMVPAGSGTDCGSESAGPAVALSNEW